MSSLDAFRHGVHQCLLPVRGRIRSFAFPRRQAAALWTFVHLKVPRFTSQSALEVVSELLPPVVRDVKPLAKRLRHALAQRGVCIKHEAALQAASRLLGYDSWHGARRAGATESLKFMTILGQRNSDELLPNWASATRRILQVCEEHLRQGSERLFHVSVSCASLCLTVRDGPGRVPLAVINPAILGTPSWHVGLLGALETVRRNLEETCKGVLDGLAVVQQCEERRALAEPGVPGPIGDLSNSELVLKRADDVRDEGFEVARGDEVACWAQFEKATDSSDPAVTLDEQGAWMTQRGRYVWELHTFTPLEPTPQLHVHVLATDAARRLLRRYHLAKKVLRKRLVPQENIKSIECLRDAPEAVRVNLPRLLAEMQDQSLTWHAHVSETGQDVAQGELLPLGFVFGLLERLGVTEPHRYLAPPPRDTLVRVLDGKLLQALMPRVFHVRYLFRAKLDEEGKAKVRGAVEEFASSLRLFHLQAGGCFLSSENQLPHLAWSSDAEELLMKFEEFGLVVSAGVMPHLMMHKLEPTQLEQLHAFSDTKIWPFSFAYSLYLDLSERDA